MVRPFTGRIMMAYRRDAQQRIVGVETGPVQVMWTEQDPQQRYLVDDAAIPGVLLFFPVDIVNEELNAKVFSRLIGKVFTDEQLATLKRRVDEHMERMGNRLGCANTKEIDRKISEGNYWEVLFSLHQIVEHRLHMLILYRTGKLDEQKSQITLNTMKQTLLKGIWKFKHLVDVAFIMDAISDGERLQILSFDSERDGLAHNLLTREVETQILRTTCRQGLEVVEMLENALSRIIPKPETIIMKRFEIQELPL